MKHSGDKTIKVVIEFKKKHQKYQKYIKVSKKHLVHFDSNEVLSVGDNLVIENVRPLSKTKHFRFVEKVKKVEL
ncbi:30S ribosomal protein S17 [Candidatus Marinamargulisbacteria bacterium SCGC AG-343-D04]|nr:30S ribosomal protein S17 [Candidatus Marinamargulisbacteria bacterium SCGC AG-343-D04]